MIGALIAAAVLGNDVRPDLSAILVLAGCVAGDVGGLLTRR